MDNNNNHNAVKILLVEDNPADRRMIQEVFKDFKTKNQIYAVKDGVEALDFLNNEKTSKNTPNPDLIVLDLNLPRMNGFEFLKEIKNDDNFKNIPVIVLTISNTQESIIKAYELQIDSFITKPLNFDEYIAALQSIEEFCRKK